MSRHCPRPGPARTLADAGGGLLVALLAACDSGGGGTADAGGGDVAAEVVAGDSAGDAGAGTDQSLAATAWVYAGGSDRIDLFAADLRTGALTWRSSVAAGDDARLAELDPAAGRVYVQSQLGMPYAVLTYDLDRGDGRLRPGVVHPLPFPGVEGVTQMQVHPTARWFMLSASNQSPGLEDRLMPLEPGGGLGMHRTVSYLFYGFTWDPSGNFFYGLDGEAIFQYAFDAASGTIAALDPPVAEGSEGRVVLSLRPHPAGKWVYSVEESELGAYAIDPGQGLLRARSYVPPPLPAEPTYWTSAIVHPGGRFLYVLGYLTDTRVAIVDLFAIEPDTGALRFVARQGGERDRQRQVQNTGLQGPLLVGDFLIVGGPRLSPAGPAALVVFRIAEADGRLTAVGPAVDLSPAARSTVSFLFSASPTP
jgi:6-phosphogluconolactonase (cycloisomerase 2 family)